MSEIVVAKDLVKDFKTVRAVDQLSFCVNEGDVYGFLGQNGAGKSTTLRMLLSLIKPGSGSIHMFGRDIQHHRKYILQQTGALIERPDVYPYLSALDNMRIFARLCGASSSRDMLLKQLAVVGLENRATHKAGGFSQGMKQRLGIAIALLHNPPLVILDEPSNGLDPQGIVDIRNLIIQLANEQKKTVIVSSHLLNEVEQMATRILIVDKGKKVAEGTTRELIDPENTLVHLKVDNKEKARAVLQNSRFKVAESAGADSLEVMLPFRDIPHLNTLLVEQGVAVFGIQPWNSLEKYFLRLTTTQHV